MDGTPAAEAATQRGQVIDRALEDLQERLGKAAQKVMETAVEAAKARAEHDAAILAGKTPGSAVTSEQLFHVARERRTKDQEAKDALEAFVKINIEVINFGK